MSRPTAPKHRAESAERPSLFHRPSPSATPARHRTGGTARAQRRRTSLVPALAILGAGVAVTAGVAAAQPQHTSPSFSAELAAATSHAGTASARKEFETRGTVRTSRSAQRTSRSAQRPAVDKTKATRLKQQTESGGQATHTQDLASQDPRTVAQALMPQFGFSSDQFSCLDALWTKESGWNPHAMNASSGAYGIPQSLPGSKMAAAGADWQTNPATQIKWGLGYIKASYGSPCGAWAHSESYGWY